MQPVTVGPRHRQGHTGHGHNPVIGGAGSENSLNNMILKYNMNNICVVL